ncbi:uncharacterized protein K452DRAFT_339467 [Aplosporella prunicola CBS 121167]|uniref:Uncharacterized protein n=1 Tax=Aplosporella prunicola CBS 121167 TaxID=1176127 RepID=A0A6A6B0Y9_9PEZI|nr:uncharacterized protein K452DRAFT_339467 [Aplosporella prunicola CBS 121167]KAF2137829.1 hypothetical protein K452DRAFT_339467 [Aplosporella prunicola CBS 121167]
MTHSGCSNAHHGPPRRPSPTGHTHHQNAHTTGLPPRRSRTMPAPTCRPRTSIEKPIDDDHFITWCTYIQEQIVHLLGYRPGTENPPLFDSRNHTTTDAAPTPAPPTAPTTSGNHITVPARPVTTTHNSAAAEFTPSGPLIDVSVLPKLIDIEEDTGATTPALKDETRGMLFELM